MAFSGNHNWASIKNGLAVLDRVFNQPKVVYRVLGSVLVAAVNKKPHRTLGDIDILIDKSNMNQVKLGLLKENYQIVTKQMYNIRWLEAHKTDSLGFTFLLVGKFGLNYFSYKVKGAELRVLNDYITPTTYHLFNTAIVGIPIRSIYEGLKISNLNPKRKLDREVIIKSCKGAIPKGASLEKSFKVFLWGKEIPYAYTLFSYLYNLWGGIRVRLGRKYEVWN